MEEETQQQNSTIEDIVFIEPNALEKCNIDWVKLKNIAVRIIDIGSIVFAYLCVFVIFSYPLLRTINKFLDISGFLKKLPLGYLSTPSNATEELGLIGTITLGIVCVLITVRLVLWLSERHSIVSRVTCILLGILFMYFMVSKEANDLLLITLGYVALILFFVYIFIPLMLLGLHPILKEYRFIPSAFTYCSFVYSFIPMCFNLSAFCRSAGQDIAEMDREEMKRIRKEAEERNRKAADEYNKRLQEDEDKRKEEEARRNTISLAVQDGAYVHVYDLNNRRLFSRHGSLLGYSSSAVTIIENTGWTRIYNPKGGQIDSKPPRKF